MKKINFFKFSNPLNNRKKLPKRKFNREKIRDTVLKIALGFIVLVLLMFAWYAKDLPTPGRIKRNQPASATQIYDRNGNELYAIHGDVKRILIDKKEMPEYLKEATITAEDRSFYYNIGIDPRGILRSIYYDVFYHKRIGGSTITQQYVKNALLDNRKTITRKMKELILTFEIEIMYSKKDILGMYLNEIPYGSNAYGVEAAAQTFLGKHAKDLDLAECATLAALPQLPSYYSPYGIHPDERLARVNWILDSMVSQKYITKEEAVAAKKEAKEMKFQPLKESISAPHFVMYVKDLLVEKYGEKMVEEGGLKVTTTLDGDKQKAAEETIDAAAKKYFSSIRASNASLVSIDPRNGQILAMVGSRDFFNQDIDGQVNVAIADRQPGSSFKPIVYATLFKKEWGPGSTLWDVTTDFGNYVPKNYDGATHGPVSIRRALANSLNIPAVKALYLAGMDDVLSQAHSMGITGLNDKDKYGLSLVLGAGEVKLLDQTSAYSVFANNGVYAPATPILKVTDSKGKVLEEFKDDTKDVLDPKIAYEISSILSDNSARSMVFGTNSQLQLGNRPVAAKTGTTQKNWDAWTMGYTPSIATGVWVGNNDNSAMTQGGAGAMAAAPIWHDYMQKVLGDTPIEEFTRPDGIVDGTIDKYTNLLPTAGSQTNRDIFADWQLPTKHSSTSGTLKVDKYTGNLATDDCPDQYTITKTFSDIHSEQPDNNAWESPVQAYLDSIGMSNNPPSGTDRTCAGQNNKTTVNLVSPSNGSVVTGTFSLLATVASNTSINNVEFFIDDASVGSDPNSPYQMTYNPASLVAGAHRITATATDSAGIKTSANGVINYIVYDKTPPGATTITSIAGGNKKIDLSWTNPSDTDLAYILIYSSTTSGTLGTVKAKLPASPSATGSTTINGLLSDQDYYITIRAIDRSGNEYQGMNQSYVKTQS